MREAFWSMNCSPLSAGRVTGKVTLCHFGAQPNDGVSYVEVEK